MNATVQKSGITGINPTYGATEWVAAGATEIQLLRSCRRGGRACYRDDAPMELTNGRIGECISAHQSPLEIIYGITGCTQAFSNSSVRYEPDLSLEDVIRART